MKKIFVTILIAAAPLLVCAQQTDSAKVVNFGVRINTNLSQPVLHGIPRDIKASPSVGAEGGMFLDFNIGRRFFIRFNTLYGLQRSTLTMDGTACPLVSASVEIPVYAAGRFGNTRTGWGFVGVGPYTEFITWGRLNAADETFNPYHHVIDVDVSTGQETFSSSSGFIWPCPTATPVSARWWVTRFLAAFCRCHCPDGSHRPFGFRPRRRHVGTPIENHPRPRLEILKVES